ncbi:MAG: hypothetical protein KatS3mg109_0270 [Pirellulaceae bacterium]|nr:MAG: hypothetical protein KatS3mg109_0270 [Pirellulaceae bacterium]
MERAAHVARLDLPAELLRDVETFACLEGILLDFAETQALQGQFQSAHDLAAKRRTGFWSLVDGETQLRWTILETASALLLVAQRIREELKAAGRDVAALVQRYTQGTAEEGGERVPWSLLDRYQRHLELRYAMLEQDLSGAHNRLAAVVRKARQAYFDVAQQGAEQFGEALEKVGFQPAGVLAQRNVFQRCVHPLLGNGKTAYVLVDALRYEMAEELIAGLGEGFDVQLRPALVQLPSITEVGMAALLPGADKGMELVDAGGGRVAVRIGRALLKDRSSRIRHFQQAIGRQVAVLKLNDLIRVTRRREEIEAAEVILVTSQEIDRRGEEAADEEEARRFMAEVLEKVRRGIRQLARLGVKHVVLTADHGHIFVDDLDDGMKVDAPGGQTIDLHPRVWMGRGGAAHPRHLRTSARQLGLHGDLELAFPRGLACFRTPGGGSGYFHGGISFQEAIVPVAVIHVAAPVVQGRDTASVELTMAKPKVTTRFFSVQATYKVSGLFGEESCRVRVLVKSERKEVGMAAMAAYGFEEGTQEIVLQRDRPNAITMMLTEEMRQGALSVHVVDATSQVELASLTSIPVEISI